MKVSQLYVESFWKYCDEPIYTQYSGVLETCLALRFGFLRCLAAKVLNSGMSHPDLDDWGSVNTQVISPLSLHILVSF